METILPSDQQPIEVRTLELFALDAIGPLDPGDFIITIKTLQGPMEQRYPFEQRIENPPQEPGPDEDDTWILTEWDRWQAALVYNQRRFDLAAERALNIAHHLLDTCVLPADRPRIMTTEDYDTVYSVAVPVEVRKEHIGQALAGFFQSNLRGTAAYGRAEKIRGNGGGHRHGTSDLPELGDTATDNPENDPDRILTDTSAGAGQDGLGDGGQGEQVDTTIGMAKEGKVTPNLIRHLYAYELRNCRTLKIRSSRSLQQWRFYHTELAQQEKYLADVQALQGIIASGRNLISQLVERARVATPEQGRIILKQVQAIHKHMQNAEKMLRLYV